MWLWLQVSGLNCRFCKGVIYSVSLFTSKILCRGSVQETFVEQIHFHLRQKNRQCLDRKKVLTAMFGMVIKCSSRIVSRKFLPFGKVVPKIKFF